MKRLSLWSGSSRRCIRPSGGRRSHPRSCSGRCCCRRSTRCARSGWLWSGWNTTFCSAGSWASASTIQPGTIRCSRRTATGCLRAPECGAGPAQGEEAAVERSLLGRRHADRGLGFDEERQPKDGSGEPPAGGVGRNAEADFYGEKRTNDTHASTTDPDARLYKKGKGKEAKLCFMGHGLMENRHGLLVDACLTLPADMPSGWRRCT